MVKLYTEKVDKFCTSMTIVLMKKLTDLDKICMNVF